MTTLKQIIFQKLDFINLNSGRTNELIREAVKEWIQQKQKQDESRNYTELLEELEKEKKADE